MKIETVRAEVKLKQQFKCWYHAVECHVVFMWLRCTLVSFILVCLLSASLSVYRMLT